MAVKKSAERAQMHVAYRLDALLHTMRAIAQCEEQLCSAMHAIQNQRSVDTNMHQELLHLLNDLPTQAYEADRNAVLDALDNSVVVPKPRPRGRKEARTEPIASSPENTAKAAIKPKQTRANRGAPRPARTGRGQRALATNPTTRRSARSAEKRRSPADA